MEHEHEESRTTGGKGISLSTLQALHPPLLRAYGGIAQGTGRLNPGRSFLLGHVHRSARRLEAAYSIAATSEEREDVHDWLVEHAADLSTFVKHLDASRKYGRFLGLAKKGWSVAATSYSVVASFLLPTAVAASVSAIIVARLNACFCEVFRFALPVLVISIFAVGIFGFDHHRSTLLRELSTDGGTTNANAYELEQRLLREVDAPRRGEVQWDVIAWFAAAAVLILARYIAPAIHSQHEVTFRWDPAYTAAGFAAAGIIALVSSLQRKWAWRPMI